jgi:hypothetical protein
MATVSNTQPTPLVPQGQNPEDWQQAHTLVDLEYQPAVSDVYRQMDIIQGFLDRDINTQKQYGEIADKRLGDIYNQLGGQLEAGVEQTGKIYGEARGRVGEAYDKSVQDIQGFGQGLQGGLAQQAQALGVEGVATGYMNPIDRVKATIAGLSAKATAAKAGSLANLDTLSAEMQAVGKSRVAGAAQEGTQKRADLAKNVQGAITKLQITGQQDTLAKLGKLTDLAETRGKALTTTLQKLADARSERELTAAKFQLQQEETAFNRMIKLRDQTLQESKANDPLGQYSKELDIAIKEGKLAKPGEQKGLAGLNAWMAAQGRTQNFADYVRSIASTAEVEGGVTKIDPYSLAVGMAKQTATKGGQFLHYDLGGKTHTAKMQHVLDALRIYFKGSGKA